MRKLLRALAMLMLIAACVFVSYALTHPEMSWPWSNRMTFVLYGAYALTAILLFALSFCGSSKK